MFDNVFIGVDGSPSEREAVALGRVEPQVGAPA
jgi:hypothetical protein